MKGIEGLPLKYIVLLLVAALVIGVVITVVTTFTGTAMKGSEGVTSTLETGLETYNQDTCISVGGNWDASNTTCCNDAEYNVTSGFCG
jgi:hypothetical protein